jgi:hypothetical protein
VVLVEDKACGAGLKVRDVSPGVDALPATAPGLPIALNSPGMSSILNGKSVRITVPVGDTDQLHFDALHAELQVHPKGAFPLLCVTGVHDSRPAISRYREELRKQTERIAPHSILSAKDLL